MPETTSSKEREVRALTMSEDKDTVTIVINGQMREISSSELSSKWRNLLRPGSGPGV